MEVVTDVCESDILIPRRVGYIPLSEMMDDDFVIYIPDVCANPTSQYHYLIVKNQKELMLAKIKYNNIFDF